MDSLISYSVLILHVVHTQCPFSSAKETGENMLTCGVQSASEQVCYQGILFFAGLFLALHSDVERDAPSD